MTTVAEAERLMRLHLGDSERAEKGGQDDNYESRVYT